MHASITNLCFSQCKLLIFFTNCKVSKDLSDTLTNRGLIDILPEFQKLLNNQHVLQIDSPGPFCWHRACRMQIGCSVILLAFITFASARSKTEKAYSKMDFIYLYNRINQSLQAKIIVTFLSIVIIGGLVALTLGILLYGKTILKEAENKVRIDLNSAWMVYNEAIDDIKIIVQMTAERLFLAEGLRTGQFEQVERELKKIQVVYHLDFLTLVDRKGKVLLRARNTSVAGGDLSNDTFVMRALKKQFVSGTQIIVQEELAKESSELVRQAFMVLVPTPKAKPRATDRETAGMALKAAVPVTDENGGIIGVLYGGKMLNRNYEIVDRIKDTVFRGEKHEGKDTGTATIFQWDLRISTNVRDKNGNRAVGTQVSSDVHERVLENGFTYIGRAFVVNANYITAYEPIRNIEGEIIGILYVGTLEQPFLDIRNGVIFSFLGIAVLGVLITLILSFFLTKSITRPISQLVRATYDISAGHFPAAVPVHAKDEIGQLAQSFSKMSQDLRRTMEDKDAINRNLKDLNQRYLELLGFTTHELKQPLGVLNGYLVMLQDESIGKLITPRQREAICEMRSNVNLMTDMIQKYLQLSKIESDKLAVNKRSVRIYQEIIQPVIKGEEPGMAIKQMRVNLENYETMKKVEVDADPLLIWIVFSNLINNAIKYGKTGGEISIAYQNDDSFHRFHVKNEGLGIPKDSLDEVFKKFTRIQREKVGRVMGTGLGLYNTKEIIEKHGGKIWAESEEGQWADFVFLIPQKN